MEGASPKQDSKKTSTSIKKVPSIKSESETQTSVAVRVPSVKVKKSDENISAGKLVTAEQLQNASIARKRRMITKKAQGVRTREKTPEPSRNIVPHEDTTTTDEEDNKTPVSPEMEADDIYLEMKKKIQEKYSQKDVDDIDINAIREAQNEVAKERRRRSISPFALPTKEEIEGLQRKGSFIDPGNKLLTTIPSYPLTPKDEIDPLIIRKNSLIVDEDLPKSSSAVPPSPTSPKHFESAYQLSTPPSSRHGPHSTQRVEKTTALSSSTKNETNQSKLQKPLSNKPDPITTKPKQSCLKTSTNVNVAKPKETPVPPKYETNQTSQEAPPVRPKRSKSGTRSQGRTSESEMSEDQSSKVVVKPQRTPKPKERRRTIAAIKRSVRERSPAARSKSMTRAEKPLDVSGIEMTKTTGEIIDLLQKARRRSVDISDEEAKKSEQIDSSRQLMTPKKTPSTPNKSRALSCPKTIKILSKEEMMESFLKAQRKSIEIERSRRSSGYIDASQSEMTSSCYSSSYSEDESDFDLSKKSAELTKKLSLLHSEKERERLKNEEKEKRRESIKAKKEKRELEIVDNVDESKMSKVRVMFRKARRGWKEFKVEQVKETEKIRLLGNRCFSDLVLLIILCGLGGVVFRYTEGAFENFYKCGVKRVKRDFIDSLWTGSHNMREEDWKSMARRKLWEFESQLHTAHEAGVHSYSGQKAWSFMNSVVYCLTVVTTIGYGHIAPSTTTGRALTIVYAIIGIPLFLILLADFGKLFTRCIKFLWAFVRRVYYTGSCRKVRRTVPVQEVMKGLNMVYAAASTFRRPSQYQMDEESGDQQRAPGLPPKPGQQPGGLLAVPSGDKPDGAPEEVCPASEEQGAQTPAPSAFEIDDEFNLPISVAITCLIIYIFMGASIYVVWEEWGFFESFYFVFISMSTIGFGDFVPNHPMYMMCSIVYLVFGMSLTSMCINVVQVKLSDTFRHASAKIGATIGLKVSEEDGSLAPITPPPVEMPGVHVGKNPDSPEPVRV